MAAEEGFRLICGSFISGDSPNTPSFSSLTHSFSAAIGVHGSARQRNQAEGGNVGASDSAPWRFQWCTGA